MLQFVPPPSIDARPAIVWECAAADLPCKLEQANDVAEAIANALNGSSSSALSVTVTTGVASPGLPLSTGFTGF